MIQKIRNKWVCCKDRFEYSDFNLIFDFEGFETHDILKSFASQQNHMKNNEIETKKKTMNCDDKRG